MSPGDGGIKKLPEVVVNRIAAGEVIQRPANVVKELIENSIDAGATQISVTVKSGGLKQIQIQDNGHGISEGDLELLCERFATSKLRTYEDLLGIASYGFRGEALASVSHCALLSVTTKTQKNPCAYKAEYLDGKLKGKAKPCAGNEGTVIIVDDLFYNSQLRRNTMKSANDEYNRIHEILSRYAIHNPSIAFSLKKHSENSVDLRTTQNSTVQGNIGVIFGSSLGKELLPFTCKNEALQFDASGFLSNPNYPVKKFVFILFINDRLVESSDLKKAIELTYFGYLPKSSHPFVYLTIKIPPHRIDVNVHPTKQQVHFLNEGDIVQELVESIESKLLKTNQSRTYSTQAALPTIPSLVQKATGNLDTSQSNGEANNFSKKLKADNKFSLSLEETQDMKKKANTAEIRPYDHELVRTDARLQRLDPFLTSRSPVPEKAGPSSPNQNFGPNNAGLSGVESTVRSKPNAGMGYVRNSHASNQNPSNEFTTASGLLYSDGKLPAEPFSHLPHQKDNPTAFLPAETSEFQRTSNDSERATTSSAVQQQNYRPSGNQQTIEAHLETKTARDKLHQQFVPPVKRFRNNEGTEDTVDELMEPNTSATTKEAKDGSLTIEEEIEQFHEEDSRGKTRKWRDIELDSVNSLRRKVASDASVPLRQLLKKHSFVGSISPGQALVQYQTGLYLLDIPRLSEELYYQAILFRFGNFGMTLLSEPAPILDLLRLSVAGGREGDPGQIGTLKGNSTLSELTDNLNDKSELLYDYFSLKIEHGAITGIPSVLSDHTPQLEGLPALAEELALHVNWEEEKACLDGISRALGRFCSLKADFCEGSLYSGAREDNLEWKIVVEHSLLPSFKAKLIPPTSFNQSSAIYKVTELQELYKVFERC